MFSPQTPSRAIVPANVQHASVPASGLHPPPETPTTEGAGGYIGKKDAHYQEQNKQQT